MVDEQRVALFGASCRAAAQAAKRAGLDKVYAWDEFLDADLAHVATVAPLAQWYQEQTEPIIDLRNCMVVLCGGMENKPQLIDRLTDLGAVAGTTGNSSAIFDLSRTGNNGPSHPRSAGLQPTDLSVQQVQNLRNSAARFTGTDRG